MLRFLRHSSSFAVACPGQGIVPRGCLHHLQKYQPLFQDKLELLDDVTGDNFASKLMEEPPTLADLWSLTTSNAQPAILLATYVHYDLFRKLYGVDLAQHPDIHYLLGHSLGEYTALTLGGAFTIEQAVKLVRARGQLLEELVGNEEFEMLSIVFKPVHFERVVEVATRHKVLACVNNDTVLLISGTTAAIRAAKDEINGPAKTILKLVQLPVKIPFHNHFIQPIEAELSTLVGSTNSCSKPVISNYSGEESVGNIGHNVVLANSTPVQWKKSMEFMMERGVENVISLGPGSVVDGINKRFSMKTVPLKSAQDMEALAQLIQS